MTTYSLKKDSVHVLLVTDALVKDGTTTPNRIFTIMDIQVVAATAIQLQALPFKEGNVTDFKTVKDWGTANGFEIKETFTDNGIPTVNVITSQVAAPTVAIAAQADIGTGVTTASLDATVIGTGLTYQWVCTNSPKLSVHAITTPTTVDTALSGLSVLGSYTFKLIVTDATGGRAEASVTFAKTEEAV